MIGLLFLFVFPLAGIALIVGGIAGAAVYDDAYKRGDPTPGAWALGTWLLLIIVLPLYLYHRSYRTRPSDEIETKGLPLGKYCGFCSKFMPAAFVFCPVCGKSQE